MRYKKTVSLAITGASGAAYALRLLECLIASDVRVYLMISQPGHVVLSTETDWKLPGRPAEMRRVLSDRLGAVDGQVEVSGRDQWTAPVASGTGAPDAMVICPCTTGTLASVACGISRALMDRAADVMLKERRSLIMVVREMPFSEIHLEHMLKLSRMGAVIMPAAPGFYYRPSRISDLVDFTVARVLDHLHLPHELVPVWGERDGTEDQE